jgi:hypothetical protein
MKQFVSLFVAVMAVTLLSACSVFGDNGVESAPYKLISADKEANIEIRNYESMVLVSASMQGDGRNSAFRKLFKYITGANEGKTEIAMTAPVFMDENEISDDAGDTGDKKGTEIAMTAPVFMSENDQQPMMSFVMPKEFTIDTTPKPTDPDVIVTEVLNYKVAAIRFSGTLGDSNVNEHTKLLEAWIQKNNYTIKSEALTAGYNGPFTLPMFRHNEVLIEIE